MANTATNAYHELLDPLSYLNININYNYIGTISQPSRQLFVFNMTNTDCVLHIDSDPSIAPGLIAGDHLFVPAFSGRVIDVSTNAFTTGITNSFVYHAGSLFWVRCLSVVGPIQGSVWIESIYGQTN